MSVAINFEKFTFDDVKLDRNIYKKLAKKSHLEVTNNQSRVNSNDNSVVSLPSPRLASLSNAQ